jgi:DNA-directed RNA polymerase specialized sigma24 family protein
MIDIDWAHFDSNIRSAIRILRGFMDPDDVTQECRIRIWEVTKSYDFSLGPYGAYVGRAIHNRALDLRRRAMVLVAAPPLIPPSTS